MFALTLSPSWNIRPKRTGTLSGLFIVDHIPKRERITSQLLPNITGITKYVLRKKNKLLNKGHFFQRGNTDGQQTHEKMLSIANHQRNPKQNRRKMAVKMAVIKKSTNDKLW